MKIQNLIENTEGKFGCAFAHGLSFYVETNNHKLLVDLGPSDETIKNAYKLGIDLEKIDTVILSHGHYDHSGGIIPFSKINKEATIYMQSLASGQYYADDGKKAGDARFRYIGIDKDILQLPQVKFVDGDYKIDDELELFTVKDRRYPLPFTNKRLLIKDKEGYVKDDFKHEHFLVVKAEGKHILISGCAHNGILSIMDAYEKKYNSVPDIVISGFHLMKKVDYRENEIQEIQDIAEKLTKYPTKFYTCHCTGVVAFDEMKHIMKDQLEYVHSGDVIDVAPEGV